MPEIENNHSQCTNMQKHIEERSCREPQKMLSYSQMSGTGDRQPFSQSLDQTKNYCNDYLGKQILAPLKDNYIF
jgi:hypothetical protein